MIFYFYLVCFTVSNELPCLKTTGLYDDILLLSSLFHFSYFIFSALISFTLCFPIFPSLFLIFFLKPLASIVEKLHTHTHTHSMYIYFRKLTSVCLKNLFCFDSICFTQHEYNDRFLIKKVDMQQRFTIQHRELQSMSCITQKRK